MPQKERIQLIRDLEASRGSRIISYVTGDRQPGLDTKIGTDVFPFFYDVCTKIGHAEKVDLFLYSTGGATMAAWGLVNLIREFFDKFNVILPFKAHSSATLIALGANEILMSRVAQLSPVDPSINSPYNPRSEEGPTGQFLPVSVEDVIGFLNLARVEAKIDEQESITRIMELLAGDVRPMALGSVYRAKQQIQMLATKLLSYHMAPSEQAQVENIVTALTRELYSHDYPIGRKEAKDLGLKIAECSDDMEDKAMALFQAYAADLKLRETYSADAELGSQTNRTANFERAYIESADKTFVFRTKREMKRVKVQQKGGFPIELIQERAVEEGWFEAAAIKG